MTRLLQPSLLLCVLFCISCGRGPDDPLYSPADVTEPMTKSIADVSNEAFTGECGEVAKSEFLTSDSPLNFRDLPAGRYEYAHGKFFVSVKTHTRVKSQLYLINDPTNTQTEKQTKKCLSPDWFQTNHLTDIPKIFSKSKSGEFSSDTKINFLAAIYRNDIEINIFDSELTREWAERSFADTTYTYIGGWKSDQHDFYRVDENTYKLIFKSMSYAEDESYTAEMAAGYFKFTPNK